jgi:hypothetical protein
MLCDVMYHTSKATNTVTDNCKDTGIEHRSAQGERTKDCQVHHTTVQKYSSYVRGMTAGTGYTQFMPPPPPPPGLPQVPV